MEKSQYIKIGDKIFSAEEVCERLSIKPACGTKIAVGHQLSDGRALEASVILGDPDDYSGVDTYFRSDGEQDILLSHTEMDVNEKDKKDLPVVRTFLYDRADSYVGYITHKTCSEEELSDEQLQATLVASGDMDVFVNVYRENQYAKWCGPLPPDIRRLAMYKVIERSELPNGDTILLEDWSEENTPEFPNLHGLTIAAYPLVARSNRYSIVKPGDRFRLQISYNSYAGYTNEMVLADYHALVSGGKKLEDLAGYFYNQKKDEWMLGMNTVTVCPD